MLRWPGNVRNQGGWSHRRGVQTEEKEPGHTEDKLKKKTNLKGGEHWQQQQQHQQQEQQQENKQNNNNEIKNTKNHVLHAPLLAGVNVTTRGGGGGKG